MSCLPFVVSVAAAVACKRHKRNVRGNDHDQARREDRKAKLAMSRTEPPAYSQCREQALTLRCCRSANFKCVILASLHRPYTGAVPHWQAPAGRLRFWVTGP